ncbi:hypothetical protein JCM6882_007897 [Rhodosporidiobolus microsporus]
MLAKPHAPTHRVPIDSIACLIPWGTVRTFLLPFASIEIGNVPRAAGPPQWQTWLEPWYQTICPAAWTLLEEDDAMDEAAVFVFEAYKQERWQAGADEEELDRLTNEALELFTACGSASSTTIAS